jgi:putative membrane protein
MRNAALAAGAAVLVLAWASPLAALAPGRFSAHMTVHILVVAAAAPLLAWGVAGRRLDPVRRWPWLFAPIAASLGELLAVWGWHAPALHQAARQQAVVFGFEQATFVAAGLWLWLSAFGGPGALRPSRAAAGVVALVFTSIHMTLLGALFALAPRPLYEHHAAAGTTVSALSDMHLGGAIMLLVGGASYLVGGLVLLAGVLRRPSPGVTNASY